MRGIYNGRKGWWTGRRFIPEHLSGTELRAVSAQEAFDWEDDD